MTSKKKAPPTLYCGHWAYPRYCGTTRGVQLYQQGFRCPAHRGSPPLATEETSTRGRAAA